MEYLHAKIQIGSVKGPIAYQKGQTVFHHDDIPVSKRLRRNEVKTWAKSKILSADKPSWNKSVEENKTICERRQMENFVKDRSNAFRYNYRAEQLDSLKLIEPIDKPTKFHISKQLSSTALQIIETQNQDRVQNGRFHRTAEMPINSKLEGSTAWQASTSFQTTELEKNLNIKTIKSLNWTKKVNETVKNKLEYDDPVKLTTLMQEEIRRQKSAGTFDPEKRLYRPPSAPVDRSLLRNRFAIEKPNKVIINQHSGVWETNKADGR
jgi:hypothetical protein